VTTLRGVSDLQYERLMSPLNPSRVKNLRGMSYLEAWDVRAHLIRVFGFGGFSVTADEAECVSVREVPQSKGDKMNHEVCWKVRVTLIVPQLDAMYTEYAIGSSSQPSLPEAHDMAIKTAESDALKRAAINLGTQFGLGLYAGGTTRDIVIATLVGAWRQPIDQQQQRHTKEEAEAALNQGIAEVYVDTITGEITEPSHTVREPQPDVEAQQWLEDLRSLVFEDDNGKRIIAVAGLKERARGTGILELTTTYDGATVTYDRLADLVAGGLPPAQKGPLDDKAEEKPKRRGRSTVAAGEDPHGRES
jgi:hypothetical protein